MEKKFTKGNWGFGENYTSNNGTHVVYSTNGSYPVQNTYIATTLSTFNSEADAKLIAAAPDLLEALTNILKIVEDSEGVVGYHLNGDTAKWDEFDEITNAIKTIKKATE